MIGKAFAETGTCEDSLAKLSRKDLAHAYVTQFYEKQSAAAYIDI